MRIKKLGAALAIITAISTIIAGSAFAEATTTASKWYTGVSPNTELTGSTGVASSQVGEASFATTVTVPIAVELKPTNVECEACTIENSGGVAVGSGKLKFTGLSVVEPAGCGISSSITTKALKIHPDYMIGTKAYVLFEPSAGAETGLATIELTGASCPISIAIVPKGTMFVEAANATGVQTFEQEVHSSAAINSTAGGTLHVGTETASLTGSILFKLSSGLAFGVH